MAIIFWLVIFLLALLQGYWFVAIATVTWFSYWYPAWWLFVVVVLVDAYFGAFAGIPVLSLSFGAFVLLVETLKMQLLGIKQ